MSLLVTDEARDVFARYGHMMDVGKRIRPLSPKEQADARKIFRESLDYLRVFISSALGAFDRPYCETCYFSITVIRDKGTTKYRIPFNILNIGGGWGDDYPRRLLHELTHVWQSQHARDPEAYFWNSMKNQAMAVAKFHDYHKCYDFVSGFSFSQYNVEQLARAVGTHQDPAIVRHIRSIGRNRLDPVNEASFKVVNGGDMSLPVEPSLYDTDRHIG